jgi:TolA-binding protein
MRNALLPAVFLLAASAGAGPWAVSDAPLRFDFTVETKPSVPAAGVLAMLPDGGLLPAPAPRPVVLDEAGKPLEFDILWHNPQEGLGLVVAPPPGAAFSVYVGRQSRLSRNERAAFTPGPLFYVKLGNASLEAAEHLPGGFPPGRDAIMGQVSDIGQMENPFGPNNHFSGWFSAWLQIAKPGRYYLATISDEGSLFRIDGKTVAEWPGQHTRQAGAKGQFGGTIELAAGPHQVDYFYFNLEGASEAQLAWRPPGATNLPVLVPASAYLHSGFARLTKVTDKDGGPVAAPQAACESYFWFGDQPDNLFRLTPRFTERNPSNTVYEWKMDDGLVVKDTNVLWIFEGSEPRAITLTARSGNRSSTAAWTVKLNTTPAAANVNNLFHRQAYRTALLNRCKAVPPPARPAASWPAGLWQVLVNVVEPFKGQGLFDELFERSRDDMAKALAPADLALMQELFMDNLRYSDKVRAAAWLDTLEKEEKNTDRRREWTLQKIELALYQAADTNLARRTAAELAAAAPGTEAGVLATVRLGDIEALAGRFDEARALYAKAQAASPRKAGALSTQANAPPAAAPGLARSREDLLRKNPEGGGLARSKEALDEDRNKKASPAKTAPAAFTRKVEAWKAEAVRGGAYYETIRDLLQKGYLREARQELRNWELELPTEKLGGEYPVAEAEFFMAVKDYSRARVILRGYRQAVDVSPFMPKAMGMELDCLQRLGLAEEADALAKIVLRRFPGHPVADQAKVFRRLSEKDLNDANPGVDTR